MSDHERTASIPLPANIARCEPSTDCAVRGKCARYQSAIPKHGAVMQDYSLGHLGGTFLCPGYLDAAAVRKAGAAIQPVQAPVKPAVRGIA